MDPNAASFTKNLRPGTVEISGSVPASLFVTVKYSADGRLSITGVEGPNASGNCRGSCGQCGVASIANLSPRWNMADVKRLREVWDRWHLHDMRAGCEHQRAAGWTSDRCGETCETCGYGYGTAWLREEVPEDVLAFLKGLPESQRVNPWGDS